MMKRKLTYATAEKIREYHQRTGASPNRIIVALGLDSISDSAVYAIIVRRTYKSIKQKNSSRVKLDSKQVRAIRGEIRCGQRLEWIALKYKVSMSCIQRIKYNLTWKDTHEI